MTRPALVVVLAAGEGTRMKSGLIKVLHPVAGRPILGHVLGAVAATEPVHTVVVVGHQRDRVTTYLEEAEPGVLTAVQEEQRGTGHAVREAVQQLAAAGIDPVAGGGPVVVLTGDTPCLSGETLVRLVAHHDAEGAAVTVLSAVLEDPTGYGRIVRDAEGTVIGIVEHKDATDAERAVAEVNAGMYAFEAGALIDALARLTTDNVQGEEYLTDVLGILHGDGRRVAAVVVDDPDEILGVNDRAQLAHAGAVLRDRVNLQWMRAGVTIVDPATTWIDADAELAPDSRIEPSCHILGPTTVGAGATVGPDTTLIACEVGAGATVLRSHCELAVIGDGATVGPFTYLRPNAQLGERSKAGAFVEIKNSMLGTGSKVPHLSYVGDATIGEGTNIGAATVFVNYDGIEKHRTVVGDAVRVGSDSMLVAPVTIGDGAYTAAGSVITDDVPPGAMAVARGRQRNIEGWVARRRAGTSSAAAAARAADAPSDASPGGDDTGTSRSSVEGTPS